jgi:hypothetical protein
VGGDGHVHRPRWSLLAGVILFPVGPVTLPSGTTVSLGAGLVRVLFDD